LNKPPLSQLMDKVDSKYTLITVAAKRARQLIKNDPQFLDSGLLNPVSVAFQDIADGKVTWRRERVGIK